MVNLKPGLSPQRNAENFYRKSRNRKIEIERLKENIRLKRSETEQLEGKKKIIENTDDLKLLRKVLGKTEIDTGTGKGVKSEFRQFAFQDYEILVGKNSKNNEKLTFGSGSKDDLWLHAKGVAGSHVIIRNKAGRNIPDPVIKRAAELAVYFSKNRNNSNCPVIVVPRKFVRKLKGGSPGQVLVDREKVIFANPVF